MILPKWLRRKPKAVPPVVYEPDKTQEIIEGIKEESRKNSEPTQENSRKIRDHEVTGRYGIIGNGWHQVWNKEGVQVKVYGPMYYWLNIPVDWLEDPEAVEFLMPTKDSRKPMDAYLQRKERQRRFEQRRAEWNEKHKND